MRRKIKINGKTIEYNFGLGRTKYTGYGTHGKVKKARNKFNRKSTKEEIKRINPEDE